MASLSIKNYEDLREQYSRRLEVRGYAPGTIRLYRIYVNQFMGFLKRERMKNLRKVDIKVLDGYQDYLFGRERKLKRASQRNNLHGLNSFFKWMRREKLIKDNPVQEMEFPKKPNPLPRGILTEKEVFRILGSVGHETKFDIRNKALLELLYATGMRSGEIVNLRISDLKLDYSMVHITNAKNRRDRVIPMGKTAVRALRKYLKTARAQFLDKGKLPWLFTNNKGRKMWGGRVATMIVKKYAKQARIGPNVTAYTLRHSMGTHLVRREAPLRYIQELLGHKYIVSTQIYTRLVPEDLRRFHRKYHPRA
ncbi:MAG: tyrosine-type recombinase/integrase [Candidatus Omnitrophica bacterium]|nr:tyrosine-type recombinase/integrase [Candidatus Omnitrophota bacterium]